VATDGDDVPVRLYQHSGDAKSCGQRSARAECSVRYAVGIESCQTIAAADHDLPVRFESDCRWLILLLSSEGKLLGRENRIKNCCFAETKQFAGSLLEAVAHNRGLDKVAVGLEKIASEAGDDGLDATIVSGVTIDCSNPVELNSSEAAPPTAK
jgi:hypothetical protein